MKYSENNIIWTRYRSSILLESAAEDMMNNVLKKNIIPANYHQLFLSKDDKNKFIFDANDIPVLYKWISSEHANTKELIKDYTFFKTNLKNDNLSDFKSYLDWTEKIHSKRDEIEYLSRHKNLKDINIEEQDKENVLANDENVLIMKGDDEHKCVRYGKGYSFCISRGGGGNMYGNYRLSKSSTFYFVFFKKIPKEDEHHIMVLDRTENGWEWTFGKNQTKKIDGGWEEIEKTFPVLKKYKNLFINKPLTGEEVEYQKKLKTFVLRPSLEKFKEFSYKEKSDVLKFGMLISLDLFQSLDKFLRNEWISVGPKMSDDIYELLNDKEKERFEQVRRQQLYQREPHDNFDIEICKKTPELFEKHLRSDKELCEKEEKKIQSMIVDGVCLEAIYLKSRYFFPNLDNLKECRDLESDFTQTISLPQLIKNRGNLTFFSAKAISLPQLIECGNIKARSVHTLSLPQLKKSGYIDVIYSAKIILLPNLTRCGYIEANVAEKISLPKLEWSGYINANSAKIISLPQLKYFEYIRADSAEKIIINKNLINKIRQTKKDVKIIDPSEYPEELNDSYIYNLIRNFLLKS